MVVDVFRLLDLGGQRAAAVSAGDQPRECKIAEAAACFWPAGIVSTVEHILHGLPKFERNERLVGAVVDLSEPFELTSVQTVSQDFVDRADRNRMPALAVCETGIARRGSGLFE
nr:hypothetical protein [Novosphingobium sp. LASN5T]